jgi:A/G-specific adenine glycosylase
MKPAERRNARALLLAWFAEAKRDLPWRRTRDAYAVWLSEVMLQQTRVDTVIPYFERFLQRFPTVSALAAAPEEGVLALWSGLGYYRRARLLHAGAKAVVERHQGVVPEDAEARRALPGIGRYTAGAIGSIAFELEEPLVDGNVARVLSRVHAIDAALGGKESEVALWREAEAWVKGDAPGELNQALMELGALVCTPSSPRCEACPLMRHCLAKQVDRVATLPTPKVKKAPKELAVIALLVRDQEGRVLLIRSTDSALGGELFKGLFNAPMCEGEGRADADALAKRVGAKLVPLARPEVFTHVLTHRRLTVHVYAARDVSVRASEDVRWVAEEALPQVGVSTLTKKILRAEQGT